MLTARWLRLEPGDGRLFRLGTGTLCTLGTEHGEPVITSWNVPPSLADVYGLRVSSSIQLRKPAEPATIGVATISGSS